MSGDIVERLRIDCECCDSDTCVHAAARDEIEQLRAEVGRWVADFQDVFVLKCKADDEIQRLRAEVERLRVENAEQAQGWRAERALADQLADALGNEWPGISNKPYSDVSTAHAATTAALSAWQEARRG